MRAGSESRRRWRPAMAAVALLCAAVAPAKEPRRTPTPVVHGERPAAAYLQGKSVQFELEPAPKGAQPILVGPWELGTRVVDRKPRDKRLNVYVVSPGEQYHAEGWTELDHNLVINDLPVEGATVEWDVFYAVVLDPRLRDDLRAERGLLVAAQERFIPGDLYDIEDAPGEGFLRELLHVDSLQGLAEYRDRDGSLPRLVLVQAGYAIRARAEAGPPATTSTR